MPKRTFLINLTSFTDGSLFELEATKHIAAVFLSTLAEFCKRYLVTYAPRGVSETGWHKLEVRVKHVGHRCRRIMIPPCFKLQMIVLLFDDQIGSYRLYLCAHGRYCIALAGVPDPESAKINGRTHTQRLAISVKHNIRATRLLRPPMHLFRCFRVLGCNASGIRLIKHE